MIYWIKKFFSEPSTHWRALCEVAVVTAFTFILYFSSLLRVNAQNSSDIAGELLERGEIFLLIYALFGTLFYLSFIHVGKPRNGAKIFIGTVITLITLPVVFMSGFDPTFKFVVNEDINNIGYFVYAAFLISYYVLLFYQELSPPDANAILKDEAGKMASQARELNK